jgi:hypothetical protein
MPVHETCEGRIAGLFPEVKLLPFSWHGTPPRDEAVADPGRGQGSEAGVAEKGFSGSFTVS